MFRHAENQPSCCSAANGFPPFFSAARLQDAALLFQELPSLEVFFYQEAHRLARYPAVPAFACRSKINRVPDFLVVVLALYCRLHRDAPEIEADACPASSGERDLQDRYGRRAQEVFYEPPVQVHVVLVNFLAELVLHPSFPAVFFVCLPPFPAGRVLPERGASHYYLRVLVRAGFPLSCRFRGVTDYDYLLPLLRARIVVHVIQPATSLCCRIPAFEILIFPSLTSSMANSTHISNPLVMSSPCSEKNDLNSFRFPLESLTRTASAFPFGFELFCGSVSDAAVCSGAAGGGADGVIGWMFRAPSSCLIVSSESSAVFFMSGISLPILSLSA